MSQAQWLTVKEGCSLSKSYETQTSKFKLTFSGWEQRLISKNFFCKVGGFAVTVFLSPLFSSFIFSSIHSFVLFSFTEVSPLLSCLHSISLAPISGKASLPDLREGPQVYTNFPSLVS